MFSVVDWWARSPCPDAEAAMPRWIQLLGLSATALTALGWTGTAHAFEGTIQAELIRGSKTNMLLYTVGMNQMRIAVTSTNWPNPIDIVDLQSGQLTLVYPHNRSFVRLNPATQDASAPPPRFPPGIGPQTPATALSPAPIGPTNLPGMSAPRPLPAMPPPPAGLPPGIGPQSSVASLQPSMPAVPMMPRPNAKTELQATTNTITILGFVCTRYVLKQRGETMEIWATDKLLPYQLYLRNQTARFGPHMLEEQWAELLTAKKLFPLLVSLRYDKGAERLRFEVKSVKAEKITDSDGKLFQPPPDYHEIQPLPF
jgi:Domain of unknown function (DUF4412)